ncbi:uncharacterized protein LOC130545787 [Triplophysa rosa]|uniref:uncharacterized protein LOC130545787 n=1 Tax=Triplophysa rosa TaxID=992332 RepID=UPI002545F3A0|nr:uncharacterized protein LOC130545787 [Triplophysa rosa]
MRADGHRDVAVTGGCLPIPTTLCSPPPQGGASSGGGGCQPCFPGPPCALCTPVPLRLRSRLDTWFLGSERDSKPRPTPVPFFPEVHEELTKTWNAPFSARTRQTGSVALSSRDGGAAKVYFDVPQVERAVAVHLYPQAASTWRGRTKLPSKACRTSASLVSKAYAAAGQSASSLYAMAILQVHQAKALKEIHEGKTSGRGV